MDPETEKQFYDLSNSFIKLANEHAVTVSPARVSAAFMYAVARYNSHNLVAGTPGLDGAAAEEALKRILMQFEKMYRENIADHVARQRQSLAP
jgi:Protein of unknown function (DUF3144)